MFNLIFSQFIELWNYQHNLVLEYSLHPKVWLLLLEVNLPSHLSPRQCVANLLSVFIRLPFWNILFDDILCGILCLGSLLVGVLRFILCGIIVDILVFKSFFHTGWLDYILFLYPSVTSWDDHVCTSRVLWTCYFFFLWGNTRVKFLSHMINIFEVLK